VVKLATVCTVLSLVVSHSWPVHQLDVKNAFLYGTLSETVYYSQPMGFVDSTQPDRVYRLNKSLYGLKQSPRAWYSRFTTYLLTLRFVEAKYDTSLFIFRHSADTIYLLFYVDDIILTASSTTLLQHTISALKREFAMKDIGHLHHFLGVFVQHQVDGLFLTQCQIALNVLEHAAMVDCKPVSMPMDTQAKVSATFGPPVADLTQFRSLTGALQYLMFTHPNITYVIQQIYLHMHNSREPHLTAMKCVLRYLRGSLDIGLHLQRSDSSSELTVYTDADRVGCPDTHRSTSGYAVLLSDNLVSWSSKNQNIISRSSAKDEYRVVANSVAEVCWLWQLL
jgi:hypothetical protein